MALAIAGGVAAFLVMGVAAVSWRAQCEANPRAGICFLGNNPAPSAVSSVVAKRAEPAPVLPVAPKASEPVLAVAAAVPPASVAQPQPTAAESKLVTVAEMMSATFETLNDLKAQINGSDPAPDPLQAAMVADAEPDVAVAAVLPTPAPLSAPTKRTVKLIPISPSGTPVTSAASDAIEAAELGEAPRAVATQQAGTTRSDPAIEAMAFATPNAVAAGTPAHVLEVDDNLVNVRSGPSTESEKLWVLKRGDEVQALAVAGDWVQVQISDGKVGWMLGEFLDEGSLDGLPEDAQVAAVAKPPATTPVAPAAEPAAQETVADVSQGGERRRVTGGGVNVRATASSSGEKLFALGPGEVVTVIGSERGWLKVTDDEGRTGWLYKDFVTGA